MEKKAFHSYAVKTSDQGVVEAIVAVMGNVDDGNDMIHPGSFAKTISERMGKIKVLDAHRTDSTTRLIGKPVEMRELSKAELPVELLQRYPESTGGLWTKTQFLIDTPEGEGAFKRIKAGVLDEWSIGYDALDVDYSKVTKDGKEITVRNLRTIKLYEYSPVLWGMNQATSTLAAKEQRAAKAPIPTFPQMEEHNLGEGEEGKMEGKPWRAVEGEDGKWRVYKLDEDGEPTGDALGTHDTEEEAQAQVRALYASEADKAEKPMRTEEDGEHPAGHYLVVEDPEKPSTWHLRVRNADGELDHRLMGAAWAALHGGYRGNRYDGPGKEDAIAKLRRLYEQEDMPVPGEDGKSAKVGRVLAARNAKRIMDATDSLHQAMDLLHEALVDAGLMEMAGENDEGKDGALAEEHRATHPTGKDAKLEPETKGAGPVIEPPTSADVLRLIEIEEEQLKLLEV